MALNLKTTEWAFTQYNTQVASAATYTFNPIQIIINEVPNRYFHSVILEVFIMDNPTSTTSVTANALSCTLQGSATSTDSDTASITNSGESNCYLLSADFTTYFRQNWGWKTINKSCSVGYSITGPTSINANAKLIITYEYDEDFNMNPSMNPSAEYRDNRVKTVRIPLESGVGALTTSLTEIGTNQVPALDTFLPESGKVYHNIWFQIEGNEHTTVLSQTLTDYRLSLALDSEVADNDGLHEAGLISARWFRRIWKRNDMATNVAHAFKLATTHIAGATFNHLSVVLYVTYSYEIDTTTTTIISLAMPFTHSPSSLYGLGNVAADAVPSTIPIDIPCSNPSLVQSGVQLHYRQSEANTFNVAAGSQGTYRAYTELDIVYCGGMSLSHRVDSGSQYGAGITIAQGANTFTLWTYTNSGSVGVPSGIGGVLYLNYTCNLSPFGEDAHPHTVIYGLIYKEANTLNFSHPVSVRTTIPQTCYDITHAGAVISTNNNNLVAYGLVPGISLGIKRLSTEGSGNGYEELITQYGQPENEAGVFVWAGDFTKKIKQCSEDPSHRKIDIQAQAGRYWSLIAMRLVCSCHLYITYYAGKYTYTGNIIGYSGDGSGLDVDIFDTNTREWVGSVKTGIGGYYSFEYHNNTTSLYAMSKQSSALMGRSNDGTAS